MVTAPQPGQARRVPEMGWLQPQQTIPDDAFAVLNAVAGGAFIATAGDGFQSLRRMMRRPAKINPATMKASNSTIAIVVVTPDSVERFGSRATSNSTECCEPGIYLSFQNSTRYFPSPVEPGVIRMRRASVSSMPNSINEDS